MFRLYTFLDWHGEVRIMRASTIHKKVVKASKKSNYGWIASASDLISVCCKKNFPTNYSIDIKAAILNCFAFLINSDSTMGYCKRGDMEAVYFAYNSLYGVEDENAIKARKFFLNAFISKTRSNILEYNFHHGRAFSELCYNWHTAKFNELIVKENINFNELEKELLDDLNNIIKTAEEKNVFFDDDKREEELLREMISSTVNDFIERYGVPGNPKSRILKK